jgi:hypothetical protein
MEERVIRLETNFEYVRRDLDDLKAGQRRLEGNQEGLRDTNLRILEKLNLLPTRSDLDTFRWQWIGIGLAIIALTVTGIAGGLTLIASAT